MLKVVRGYNTELDLNNMQRSKCLGAVGTARLAYNWGLRQNKETIHAKRRLPTAVELHCELNKLKQTEYGWMYAVSKCASQEALRDLDTAFEQLFNGKTGLPTPKKCSHAIRSFTLTGRVGCNCRG